MEEKITKHNLQQGKQPPSHYCCETLFFSVWLIAFVPDIFLVKG